MQQRVFAMNKWGIFNDGQVETFNILISSICLEEKTGVKNRRIAKTVGCMCTVFRLNFTDKWQNLTMETVELQAMFAFVLLLLMAAINTVAFGQRDCKSGTKYLDSTGYRECFALVDVSSGPYTQDQALQKCQDSFSDGTLVHVQKKVSFIRKLNRWLKQPLCFIHVTNPPPPPPPQSTWSNPSVMNPDKEQNQTIGQTFARSNQFPDSVILVW